MKNLNLLLQEICSELDLPFGYDDAISKGKDFFLHLEYAKYYGGYRLINVRVEGGGHFGAFGESSCVNRRSNKQMTTYLNGILTGIRSKELVN